MVSQIGFSGIEQGKENIGIRSSAATVRRTAEPQQDERPLLKAVAAGALKVFNALNMMGCHGCNSCRPEENEGEGEPVEGESPAEGEIPHEGEIPVEGESPAEGEIPPEDVYYNLDVTSEPLPTGLTGYIIDDGYEYGDNSVLVDSDDNAHLIYKGSGGKIAYANNIDGVWKAFCFENVWNSGRDCAIAADDKGKLHISTSVSDGNNESLCYITNETGNWSTKYIDTGLSVGIGNDIAVDKDGKIHVSHWSWNKRKQCYTSNSSGKWMSETICDSRLFDPSSIMIDSAGNPNITYTNAGWLSTASKNGDSWSFEELPISGYSHSAVMDEKDNIYLVSGRYLAVRNNGVWQSEEILSERDFRQSVRIDEDALAMDANKNLHYCFSNTSLNTGAPSYQIRIIYASNICGEWKTSVVDEWEGYSFESVAPALALDSSGNVHMSYSRWGDGKVRYVTFNPATDLANSE